MSVDVEVFSPTGSAPLTIFSDSLIGVDQPFGVGDLWTPVISVANPPLGSATDGDHYAAGIQRGGTGLGYTNPTIGSFQPIGGAIPIQLDYSRVLNRNQFVEVVPVSNNGLINRLNPVVLYVPNFNSMYQFVFATESMRWALDRIDITVTTPLIATSVATAYSNLDVMKLEADLTTTPGTTILTIKKNGVQVGQYLDNSVGRYSTGVPGLFFAGSNPGANTVIKNYRGGAL